LLQTPNIFWLYGRNISLSYLVYMVLLFLGRQIYIEHSHYHLGWVPLSLRWLLKGKKSHHQVLIKSQQHWLTFRHGAFLPTMLLATSQQHRQCIIPQNLTHSLVLPKLGKIISWNMLSWLELLISHYCCI
jgi:hypothetical protein